MTDTSTLIILSSPPSQDLEPLELALALAAFDHPVTLLLTGAGIGWLNRLQQPRKPAGKSPDKLVGALPMYDIERVYYSQADQRKLTPVSNTLHAVAKPLETPAIQQLLQQHKHCLRF